MCERLQNPNTLNISGHIYKILKRSLKCKPREDELILSCVNLAFKCLVTRYMILVQLRLVAFHNFSYILELSFLVTFSFILMSINFFSLFSTYYYIKETDFQLTWTSKGHSMCCVSDKIDFTFSYLLAFLRTSSPSSFQRELNASSSCLVFSSLFLGIFPSCKLDFPNLLT